MANLKSLKNRIKSVQSTKKITQAMKLVSASKLKKARDAMEDNRPYIQNMDHLVASLVREVPFREQIPILCGRDNPQNYLIIAIGSERGLCGGFNSNLAKSIKKKIIELKSQGKNVRVEVIGNKIYTLLQSVPNVQTTLLHPGTALMTEEVKPIVYELIARFNRSEFDVCLMYYNQFVSVMARNASMRQVLPLYIEEQESEELPLFECDPGAEFIVKDCNKV